MVTLIYYLISFLIQPLKIVHWLEPAVITSTVIPSYLRHACNAFCAVPDSFSQTGSKVKF